MQVEEDIGIDDDVQLRVLIRLIRVTEKIVRGTERMNPNGELIGISTTTSNVTSRDKSQALPEAFRVIIAPAFQTKSGEPTSFGVRLEPIS